MVKERKANEGRSYDRSEQALRVMLCIVIVRTGGTLGLRPFLSVFSLLFAYICEMHSFLLCDTYAKVFLI